MALLGFPFIFLAHEDVIEDVAWQLEDDNLFGPLGDHCKLTMWQE